MSYSTKTYRCPKCRQTGNFKGWGTHSGSTQCVINESIYKQGWYEALEVMQVTIDKADIDGRPQA